MRRTLLLNAGYEPLNFITDHRAIGLLIKGRAEVIVNMEGKLSVWDGKTFNSPTTSIQVPATLRLISRVNSKQRAPKFRKKVLFNRDDWKCQYCNTDVNWKTAEVEHIMPSSRGGKNSWFNCVTSCHGCNKFKGNKTPEEAGMRLLRRPTMPNSLHFWDISKSNHWHSDWKMFIG